MATPLPLPSSGGSVRHFKSVARRSCSGSDIPTSEDDNRDPETRFCAFNSDIDPDFDFGDALSYYPQDSRFHSGRKVPAYPSVSEATLNPSVKSPVTNPMDSSDDDCQVTGSASGMAIDRENSGYNLRLRPHRKGLPMLKKKREFHGG